MSTLRDVLRRSARATALARGVRDAVVGPSPRSSGAALKPAQTPGADGVAELLRVSARVAAAGDGPRLTLLIPTIRSRRLFGGARTALDLFEEVAERFPRRRIATFMPFDDSATEDLRARGYVVADPGGDAPASRVVVAAPAGPDRALAVGPDDVFLATFWTTAELAARLVRWQAATFGGGLRPFAYLIQDFEPGFHPWSAQSELARATYRSDVPTIAIVNSSLLAAFLDGEGLAFASRHTFEPRLHPSLRSQLSEPARPRQRRIVVYGRPGTPRNGFPLAVDGLRAWRAGGAGDGWEVVSAGEPHPPVDLGGGLAMRRLGKLPIEAYGALLRESAVGLSLMVSPHPSYPPLDMAHLGMRVVTNRFGPKDLATWHENISSVERLTADDIGVALRVATDRFERDPAGGDAARPLRTEYLADGPLFPFAGDVAAELLGGSSATAPA